MDIENKMIPSKWTPQDAEFVTQYRMDVLSKLEDHLSEDFVTSIEEIKK
jgi:hypothetical protein